MEEDRLSLFLRERVELELPEQRPPHFSPSLASETSKQRGAVLLVFSEELAQFLVFPPVLHLVVPAVVIGTVSSGGGETAGLVTVGTQGGGHVEPQACSTVNMQSSRHAEPCHADPRGSRPVGMQTPGHATQ